ncbi:GIY-YIG nuclease family protein [uncultured Anaerococcus sp.]|uniref:GIY-YIG nuclease family protein n=1 Tax=uncultured Anaerococcus sp. TaxID=293428 RepID=UPI00288937FC|nr:GIY-YIG nuclease family protein [uncultured Anaerococcus sp.]
MYYVYILMNKSNERFYVGHAYDLRKRVWEHKNHVDPDSHTAKYNITKLVYFECGDDFYESRAREKQIKKYSREKKYALIEKDNSYFRELYYDLF